MGSGILAGEHLGHGWLAMHRARDGGHGGLVVVLIDLLVVGCLPVDEHPAHDDEILGIALGDHASSHAVGDSLGHGSLCGAEHLHRLLGTLDRHLGDHHGGWLDGEIRRQHGQQVGMSLALTGQSVGKSRAHRAILAADQQIDVGNLVAFAAECFANEHRHVGCLLESGV